MVFNLISTASRYLLNYRWRESRNLFQQSMELWGVTALC